MVLLPHLVDVLGLLFKEDLLEDHFARIWLALWVLVLLLLAYHDLLELVHALGVVVGWYHDILFYGFQWYLLCLTFFTSLIWFISLFTLGRLVVIILELLLTLGLSACRRCRAAGITSHMRRHRHLDHVMQIAIDICVLRHLRHQRLAMLMLQRKLLKLILALTVISHHIIIMRWLILEGGILIISCIGIERNY